MKRDFLTSVRWVYKLLIKPVLFLCDPEKVHHGAVRAGEYLGASRSARAVLRKLFSASYPSLSQNVFGVSFASPVGLAAGFDYEARLTSVLPCVGFGFGTVGTLTKHPYEGNARPMLGRLPQSKSLLVNKGFKNLGVTETLRRLRGAEFLYPVGVSIGKTNSTDITTQEDAVRDVVSAFEDAERSGVPFAYYELNISCPNLSGSVEFYEPTHLTQLLSAVGALRLSRPVWVKMPISKTDEEIRSMLDVIVAHSFVSAVVFGNLQRDNTHHTLKPHEVGRFSKGNFSGLPCRERSDELIALTYREYGSQIKIIGCGGIFSAEDAYRKIRLGAVLVQLITGLIYEGPQLAAEINYGIARLLTRDGFLSVSEAVGSALVSSEA